MITIRGDGRPQSSDVSYYVDGDSLLVSVTDSRAKTKNLRRDPRCVFHITDPGAWSYVSFDGVAELMAPAAASDDATADALVDYYRAVAGQDHPDWEEYREAMVDEGRLIVRFTPAASVGQIHSS